MLLWLCLQHSQAAESREGECVLFKILLAVHADSLLFEADQEVVLTQFTSEARWLSWEHTTSSVLAETTSWFPASWAHRWGYISHSPFQLDVTKFLTVECEKRCKSFPCLMHKNLPYNDFLPCPHFFLLWFDKEKHKDPGSHVSKTAELYDKSLES